MKQIPQSVLEPAYFSWLGVNSWALLWLLLNFSYDISNVCECVQIKNTATIPLRKEVAGLILPKILSPKFCGSSSTGVDARKDCPIYLSSY